MFRVVWILHFHHPELTWATITDLGNPYALVWARDRELLLPRARFLEDCLDSIEAQDYPALQLIVTDPRFRLFLVFGNGESLHGSPVQEAVHLKILDRPDGRRQAFAQARSGSSSSVS